MLKSETDDGCVILREWADGTWQTHTFGEKREPVQAAFCEVGIDRYAVEIPPEVLCGHKQLLLRVN